MKTKYLISGIVLIVILGLSTVYFQDKPSEEEQEISSLEQGSASLKWELNYETALEKAKAENKTLMIEFTGSDWCPPCIQLNKDVLSTDTFKDYAMENLVLLYLDFPRNKEISDEQRSHNSALATQFGIQGFPTVILMNPEGKVLDQSVGYPRGGLSGFMDFLKKNS